MTADFEQTAATVRLYDRDRYLCALLAPAPYRNAILSLYAYSAELARVQEMVSEPLPGEVRLQWWRDLLEGTEHGVAAANPVANALLDTLTSYSLPRQGLIAMSEARIFDLYHDPMPSLHDLEGYTGETVSGLIQLACLVLNGGKDAGTATAAGHAGVAYGLTGLMRALPWHAARRQMYLPKDVIERHGLDPESLFKGTTSAALKAVLMEMRAHVRHHLGRVKAAQETVPGHCANAFLPLVLVEPYLKRMEADSFDPLKQVADLSQVRRQWIIWRGAKAPLARL